MIAADLRDALDPDERRSGAPHISDDVEDHEFTAAAAALARAIDGELAGNMPSDTLRHSADGSAAATKPLEDFAYIPRSPEVSLLQSALDRWLTE